MKLFGLKVLLPAYVGADSYKFIVVQHPQEPTFNQLKKLVAKLEGSTAQILEVTPIAHATAYLLQDEA